MALRRFSPAIVVVLVGCEAAVGQATLLSILPPDNQLESAAATGDMDGTGTGDFVVSDGMLVIRAYSSTGAVLWTASSTSASDRVGFVLADSPDVNGDGAADVIATCLQLSTSSAWNPCMGQSQSLTSPGYVRMLSGADGSTLWTAVRGPALAFVNSLLGRTITSIADQNGDGVADLLATQTGYVDNQSCPSVNVPGTLWVLSGVDGSTIRTHVGIPGDRWPSVAIAMGDLDVDGVEDYAVAGGTTPTLTAYSGQLGTPMWTTSVPPLGPNENIQDLTAVGGCDGRSDLVLQTEHWISSNTTGTGARLFDGNTGASSWTHSGIRFAYQDQMGAAVGDVDGDGLPDLAVSGGPGIQVLSVATGALLPGTLMTGVVSELDSAPDFDGDGDGELLALRFYGPPELRLIGVGDPSPQAAFTPVGNACGPGLTPPVLSVSNPPALGSSITLSYDNAQPGSFAVIAFGDALATPISFGTGCQIWIDLQAPMGEVLSTPVASSGIVSVPVSIPGVCQLIGATLRLQGVAFPVATPSGIELTSGYDLTVGF